MVTNNLIPDMMPAHCWSHPIHSVPLRRGQGTHGTVLPHRSTPTPHGPNGGRASVVLESTSSGMRRQSLATPAPSSTCNANPMKKKSAGSNEASSGLLNGEEDDQVLGPGPLTTTAAASTPQKPIRRRMRMITSCLECRRRKLKCEKKHPCHNCKRFQRECVYLGPNLDEASQQRLTEIKEKVGSLERQLERDVAKGATTRRSGSGSPDDGSDPHHQRFVADDVENDLGEERELQITPMVALDLTYDDYSDGNGTDDLIDLGIRVGKMRITERIGGLNRPRISEEIQAGIADTQNQLYGTQSAFVASGGLQDVPDIPDFLKPGDSYLAPTSGFFFGQFTESPTLLGLLPPIELGHRLMHRYLEAVHPIARCVHRSSFEAIYTSFWEEVRQGIEPRASVQAVVFAAWFSAAVSVDDSFCRGQDCSKAQLVLHMKIGTETALSKANFLSTTRFETLQGFVMYLLPLCRDEISRAHSVLVGAAVRVAECMGLHRDGSAYGLTPLETQVRRLVWHQLCFLDVRTCEAQGPKPAIRREDYDTKMPFNCEEDQLTPQAAVWPAPAEAWTSMLLPIMRSEINEMMRNIWTDRRKLENRKTTLTAMLTRVENFRKRMLEKYSRQLDDRVPIQMYARLVMELLIFRLHVMVLHPYHSNAADPLPEKLSGLLVTSGVMIIEIAIRLETNPMFRDWAWYLGAYQQYQIALLLATEVFYRPNHRAAERIWPCLDWVFQLDPNVPREQKSLQILTEIMSKTNLYMSLRKVRAPTTINKAVPGKKAVKESPPPPPPLPEHPPLQTQSQGHPYPPASQPRHSAAEAVPVLKTEHITCPPPLSSSPSGPINSTFVPNTLPPSSFSMDMMLPPQPQLQDPRQHHYQQQHQHQHQHQQHQHQHQNQQYQHQHQQHQPLDFPPPNHHHMVFTGVTNGEALWGLPPQNAGAGSPENSSDGGSVAGQQRHGSFAGPVGHPMGQPPVINVMQDLDWEALNELFPTDPQTGQLSFDTFLESGMGPW